MKFGRPTVENLIGDLKRQETLLLYPRVRNPPNLSNDIPKEYRDDYLEAHRTLDVSAKASAALSRRALQRLIRNKVGIKPQRLVDEIDDLLKTSLPSHLSESIHAIRHYGNFAAHPLTDVQTGQVLDVEPGEAEWTLEILSQLLDYYFVQPAKIQQRKTALNNKLQQTGSKPMP
jgi:hypothetical protein